jgi:hypothetical protein
VIISLRARIRVRALEQKIEVEISQFFHEKINFYHLFHKLHNEIKVLLQKSVGPFTFPLSKNLRYYRRE